MNFCMVGIDHTSAPVALREKLFLNSDRSQTLTREIVSCGLASSAVVLSTCARTEIYAEGADPRSLVRIIAGFSPLIAEHVKIRTGPEALEHLFRVASGVDSPVFGDTDLLGQVRDVYIAARDAGTAGPGLMRIFERALCAGRDIRSRLAIGPKDSSVGVKAVEHARRLKGGLAGKTVFVLGAGVVAQSVVVELCQEGAHCGIVATKTFARAAALAGEHGCTALRFEDFYSALSRADIVFGTSASPHLLLSADCFQKYSVPGREMLLIDLAVPRDIDPAIGMARGATLLTVDDIVSVPSEDIRAQAGQMAEQKARLFWGREGYDTQGGMSTEPARQDPGR